LVGGFQVAGSGSLTSQDFTVTSTYWGPTNPLKVYKHGMPVTDCESGNCLKSYEWFNGYIAPTAQANNTCSAGLSTVVNGLSSNWAPYAGPSDQVCAAPVNGKTVTEKYYNSDYVNMTLTSGKSSAISYQPYPTSNNTSGIGSNPYAHTVLNGPFLFNADLSFFKVFPITEKKDLRFNVDAFNAFNIQGEPNPSGTTGLVAVTPGGLGASSANSPRQIQMTLRLTF